VQQRPHRRNPAQKQPGQSAELCPQSASVAGTRPGGRRSGAGQQPCRECHSADSRREEELVVHGNEESGHRSAVMYTLIQSCRIIGIEPSVYLRDVLENIPMLTHQQLVDWTPKNWAIRKGLLKTPAIAG